MTICDIGGVRNAHKYYSIMYYVLWMVPIRYLCNSDRISNKDTLTATLYGNILVLRINSVTRLVHLIKGLLTF